MYAELETIQKDKHVLSVAQKTSKHELKEAHKASEKKIEVYEKKVKELNEYKIKKIGEEREERIRRKKDIKRAKKEASIGVKKDINANLIGNTDDEEKILHVINKKVGKVEEKILDISEAEETRQDSVQAEKTVFLDSSPDLTEKSESEDFVTEEDENFIGPKMPKLMSREETDAFIKEILAEWRS